MWLKAVLSTLLGVNAKPMSPARDRSWVLAAWRTALSCRAERADRPKLHWPSTAIMTLRAAACRLAISGR